MDVRDGARVGTAWHVSPGALSRFASDLIAAELAQLRPGAGELPSQPWPPATLLGPDGLGLDSLDRLSVASALSEALHLHESTVEHRLLALPRLADWLQLAASSLAGFDARITFRTSGSTGQRRPCTHALADLEQEVDALAALLGRARRVLSAVPAHHIYGFLFTVLLPERLGGIEVVDVRRVTPQALPGLLTAGDLLVSHPAHWTLVARHATALPAGVTGVTSTAPCPPELAQALATLGLQRLVQVYGSSETAGIGWRDVPAAPYRLLPHWSRDPSDPSRLQRPDADGALRNHALQDRVDWQDETLFNVQGRLDAAVQVGGTNVFPAHVRDVLLAHPAVRDAAVRLMQPHEGQRLKAFIVAEPGTDLPDLPAILEKWVNALLATPERPRAFTLGDRLPITAQGKACDWTLDGRSIDPGSS